MVTTPKKLIKILQQYTSQDEVISVIIDTSTALKEYISKEFSDVYSSADKVPDELVKLCFNNVDNDDRVADAIVDSYDHDVKGYIDRYMQEHDDNELWDIETDTKKEN